MSLAGTRNRRRMQARRCAVQALYQWLLGGAEPAAILREFQAERPLGNADPDYLSRLVLEIPGQAAHLQALLATVIARPWGQIDPVERAVLLLGAYELEACPEIPWRVVINEAVELAKVFGAEQGHRFVNATLDRLAHALRGAEVAAG